MVIKKPKSPLLWLLPVLLVCLCRHSVDAVAVHKPSILRQVGGDEGPFSFEVLQPSTPADSIPSSYSLLEEIFAWSQSSVLASLLAEFPDLVATANSAQPLLVFAPDNVAFTNVISALAPGLTPSGTPQIVQALKNIWDILLAANPAIPTIKDVLTYHIVAQDLSELAIVENSPLVTLFDEQLTVSGYPTVIEDLDPVENSKRLGRQIQTINGRVSFIDTLLLPFNLVDALTAAGLIFPVSRQSEDDGLVELFVPFRSILNLVSSRTDLLVLRRLVSKSDILLDVLSNSPELHVFAPTDRAFISLVQTLVPENAASGILPTDVDSALGNEAELNAFADRLAEVWELLEGVPSLVDIVTYHVLATTASFEELVGTGPQETLLSTEAFPFNEITVVDGAVQDADDTGDTNLIASFATRNGFVSVMDGVLVPFTVEAGQAAVLALLESNTNPSPEQESEQSPEAQPEPSTEVLPIISAVPSPLSETGTNPSPEQESEQSPEAQPESSTEGLPIISADPSPLSEGGTNPSPEQGSEQSSEAQPEPSTEGLPILPAFPVDSSTDASPEPDAKETLEAEPESNPGGFPILLPVFDPFSDSSLQPESPADSISSKYSLLEELSAWQDLSVLVTLVTDFPDLVTAAKSADPLLVFAPTNDAFLAITRFFVSDTPEKATSDAIVFAFREVWENLVSSAADLATVVDVLTYHIAAGDFSEEEIKDARRLQTLFERRLGTGKYPGKIFDANPGPSARRLGRQISTLNGRISFIDGVLVPFNTTNAEATADIRPPPTRQEVASPQEPIDQLFKPFRSIINLVTSRTDLLVLRRLVSKSDILLDVLSNSPELHVFAPTDRAFISLVQTLVPENAASDILPTDVDSALGNEAELNAFADRLAEVWELLEGVPSLVDIVTYHVLATTASFEELVGAGPQETLFSTEAFPLNEITVVDGAVQDADDTGDTNLIASFATRNGFVSVMDGVLVPFTVEAGQVAVLEALTIGAVTPEPSSDSSDLILPNTTSPSPSTGASDNLVCFPADASVLLANGQKLRMDELEAGHSIHVGKGSTSSVFLFTHRQPGNIHTFIRITTISGRQVSLTPSHYLYANQRLAAAKAVKVGDVLETVDGASVVKKTEWLKMSGLYAPHTIHGDLLVDGIRVSGYSTALHPRLAHSLLAPVRLFVKVTGVQEPLGGLFYEGADRIARIMPSGSLTY